MIPINKYQVLYKSMGKSVKKAKLMNMKDPALLWASVEHERPFTSWSGLYENPADQ